jgi:hypothetical protein
MVVMVTYLMVPLVVGIVLLGPMFASFAPVAVQGPTIRRNETGQDLPMDGPTRKQVRRALWQGLFFGFVFASMLTSILLNLRVVDRLTVVQYRLPGTMAETISFLQGGSPLTTDWTWDARPVFAVLICLFGTFVGGLLSVIFKLTNVGPTSGRRWRDRLLGLRYTQAGKRRKDVEERGPVLR